MPVWRAPCPRSAIRLALSGLRLWPVSNEKISLEYKLKRFLEGCLLTPERAHIHWNGTFSEAAKAALLGARSLPPWTTFSAGLREQLTAHAGLAHISPSISNTILADDILVKSDRMSMAHAVEVRPPFLDHRIVEFAATLPDSLKIQGSSPEALAQGIDERQTAAADPQPQKRSGSTFRRTSGFAALCVLCCLIH